MKSLIKGGWVLDPAQNIDQPMDVLIRDGKIGFLGKDISEDDCIIIDATGKYVVPGLIDMHVHLREPGFEQKETIQTGAMAAAAGGFTSIVCMPNTYPVIDSLETIDFIKEKGKTASCNIFMMGSITKNLDGKELNDYKLLKEAGILGITDDGKSVMNTKLMYEAMEKAKELDLLMSVHCEDTNLVYDRSIHRGKISQILNLQGIPAAAEELIILRDIYLSEVTGARVHIQHISTKKGVELVREAKRKGIRVTCEATPHHFTLTDESVLTWGSYAKMSPPLRTNEDVEAVKKGLIDGTIDVIATDHAPHTIEEKNKNLIEGANGIVGLETALGLALTELVHGMGMGMPQLIKIMSDMPAKILNIQKGALKTGWDGDITILDINKEWSVDEKKFKSKSRNMPFGKRTLKGKAILTMVNGQITYQE